MFRFRYTSRVCLAQKRFGSVTDLCIPRGRLIPIGYKMCLIETPNKKITGTVYQYCVTVCA